MTVAELATQMPIEYEKFHIFIVDMIRQAQSTPQLLTPTTQIVKVCTVLEIVANIYPDQVLQNHEMEHKDK